MKNPVTTILGVVQFVITLIAVLFPKLFGMDWANADFQDAVMGGLAALASAIVSLVNIFKAGDKGGM